MNDYYRFATKDIDLTASRLTAMELVEVSEGRFELLLAKKPRAGYAQLDHHIIRKDYDINNSEKVLDGLYFETEDSKRYLIISTIEYFVDLETEYAFLDEQALGVLDALKRYKIDFVFSKNNNNLLSPYWIAEKVFPVDDFEKQVDALIYDDWTKNMAAELGWTYKELIRFRATGELPLRKN